MNPFRKSIRGAAFVLCLVIILAFTVSAEGGLLKNGELAVGKNDLPADWYVVSYLSGEENVSVEDGVLKLRNDTLNDLRLCQLVDVEEGAVYTLTAEIASDNVSGGRGASLCIDNYDMDGCYLYSDSVVGTQEYQTVSLSFQTALGQKQIRVALRLGGYSETSTGTAFFRNVTLEQGAPEGTTVTTLTASEHGGEVPRTEINDDTSEAHKIFLRSVPHLLMVSTVILAVVLVFGFYRNRERLGEKYMEEKTFRYAMIIAVVIGLALRSLLCSLWGGHDTDMSCWISWGNDIARNGTVQFYTAAGHEWYDYPPGYMLVLGLLAKVELLLRISADSDTGVFLYMLPAYIADVLTACLLCKTAWEQGFSLRRCFLLALFVIFDPAAVVLSGAWGQIDSILTLFLLLSFREMLHDRRIAAGAIFGAAVMIKWQALIYGPVLAAVYIFSLRTYRQLRDTALGIVAALTVILVVSLPFKGEQGLFWVVGRFLNAAGGYDYASVEAYNFLSLFGGNWTPTGNKMLGIITYRAFGLAGILLAVGLSICVAYRRCHLHGAAGSGLSLTAGFCMFMIYTFGFYMHERYVFPVILLLLFAYVYEQDERWLLFSLLLSCVVYLNETNAMFVISELASSVVRGGSEHNALIRVCSVAESGLFLWFGTVFLRRQLGRGAE